MSNSTNDEKDGVMCFPPRSGKTWSINGLTYTFGGLVLLFVLMLTGDFAWAFKERSVVMITKLLFKKFGASDFINGLLIISLPSLFGVILSPIVSYRSDRHRGRFGRRIPYLLYTTPIALVGLIGLSFSPIVGALLGGNTATLILLAFFWMLFELAMIIASAVFYAFANDVVPNELLGRFFGLFRIVSLAAGIIFSYWMLGWCETHAFWMFLGVAVLYGGGMALLCFKVKEGTYPPPPFSTSQSSGPFALTAVRTYFRECFGNSYYLLVFTAMLLLPLGFLPYNTYCIFYATDLGLSVGDYGRYLSWSFLISAILAYPTGCLADRFHPLRVCIAFVALYAVAMFLSGFFVTGPRLEWLARGTIALAAHCGWQFTYDWDTIQRIAFASAEIIHSVICGLYLTASASLGMKLLPQERFAQFSSAAGLIGTLANVVFAPAVGLQLDWTGNDYLYLFWIGAVVSLCGVVCGLKLYMKFNQLGGVQHYQPPAVGTEQKAVSCNDDSRNNNIAC